jgi:hypothetical protein
MEQEQKKVSVGRDDKHQDFKNLLLTLLTAKNANT